jgi:glyoxylase-like metal-dependent hydrolase (beta-lactamase superfamily II)
LHKYTITPLKVGVIKKTINAGPHFPAVSSVVVESPIISFLVLGGDHPILVDTGPCLPEQSAKTHYPMIEDESLLLPNQLKARGLSPSDFKIIINTHLHWDHCYYNHLFTKADIYVQKKELAFAVNPIPCHYVFYDAFQIGSLPAWTAASSRFKVIDGDFKLADGLDLIFLPGHTPGSMALKVQTDSKAHVIAGDCVATLVNWETREFGFPVPGAIHTDLVEYYQSFRRLLDLEAIILPSHDFSTLATDYPASH